MLDEEHAFAGPAHRSPLQPGNLGRTRRRPGRTVRVVQLLRRAYERFASLVHELLKFGTVGALAFVIDFGGTNLLRFGIGMGPISSKVVATVIAATFAY